MLATGLPHDKPALHLHKLATPNGAGIKMTNKRVLKQQYLETKTRSGVYTIKNLLTGRSIVAGSTNVHGILNRHRFELRHGIHRNPLLSQEWLLHGEDSFSFEVLDILKPSEDLALDVASELEDLVALWRQEIPCEGEKGYALPRRTS